MPNISVDEPTKKDLDWYLIELASELKEIPTFSQAIAELLKDHRKLQAQEVKTQ